MAHEYPFVLLGSASKKGKAFENGASLVIFWCWRGFVGERLMASEAKPSKQA